MVNYRCIGNHIIHDLINISIIINDTTTIIITFVTKLTIIESVLIEDKIPVFQ